MTNFQQKDSPLLRVFVYGTLKPGEMNYQRYCAGKVVDATPAIALGELFALPIGYPAMTLGNTPVHGYLLCFADEGILTELDHLEDYQPERPESKNLYNRRQVEVYDQQGRSLPWAWAYFMSKDLVAQLGGSVQSDGLWTS